MKGRQETGRTAAVLELLGGALRGAVRSPLQTVLTVLALGIGIAAPATMFSVVRGFTGDLDLPESERIIHVGRRFTPRVVGIAPLSWLWPGVTELDVLESVGIYSLDRADVGADVGPAQRFRMVRVTPGVFEAFGVPPALGRTFVPGEAEEEGSPVVLGWGLWQNRFGGDPSILGSVIRVNGSGRTVVGVMPAGFESPAGVDLWMPLDVGNALSSGEADYQAVGRLADGATLAALRQRVERMNAALRDRGEEVPPAQGLATQQWRHRLMSAQDRRMLSLLVVIVGFVLVIACVNVVNLLLARALHRSQETAVRVALGASRARVMGGHLAEAVVLAAAGGLVGLALTVGAVRVFEVSTAGQLAHWMDMAVDVPVLLFGVGLVGIAALGTGVIPALQSGRMDLQPVLQEGGRGGTGFRIGRISKVLVVGELTLSCALLGVAGIMVRGALGTLDGGRDFATSTVLTARSEIRPEEYDRAEARVLHRRLLEEMQALPGVESAALSSALPGVGPGRRSVAVTVREAGSEAEDRTAAVAAMAVSPSFLSALDLDVLLGRGLTWEDGIGDDMSVMVSEGFARRHLPRGDALGTRLRVGESRGSPQESEPWLTVVGVVPELGGEVRTGTGEATVYLPLSLEPTGVVALLLRSRPGSDPLSLGPALRDLVASVDRDLALWDVASLEDRIREARAVESSFAALFLSFGIAGLLLAGVGLYGLLAFTVRKRIRELGIRLALGAAPLRVLRAALGGGALQLGLGLALGLGIAALVSPLLGPALMGADPGDPLVYGLVAGVFVLVALLAAIGPARRVLALDVTDVLRAP